MGALRVFCGGVLGGGGFGACGAEGFGGGLRGIAGAGVTRSLVWLGHAGWQEVRSPMFLRLAHALCARPLAPAGGRRCGLARRVLADCGGTAILEFALVAPLFLALLMAVLQLALVYLGQQGLEATAEAGARLLQAGQPQAQGWSARGFKQAVCANLPPFMSCNRLFVDVTGVAGLADAASLPPVPSGVDGAYAPGGPDALVVLRISYLWPTGATPMGLNLANQPGGGARLLLATQLFRTEPYVAVTR